MKLSVIIANYNYRAYVGAAIASALAVDWPAKEVIIVDDASTDDSREVIAAFRDRAAVYFRPKSHQLGAHSFGFAHSTGDVVILLDADDLLEPEVMREIAPVWRPGLSKVHYRMALIGADGTPLGMTIPQFPPRDDPERLRRTHLRMMAYTTPPGSGNAYARDFLAKAYVMAPPTMRASDDALTTLAPLLGDVVTIRKPLARYRIHGANASALQSVDAARLRRGLFRDVEKARLFAAACERLGLPAPRDPLGYSWHHLQGRLASYLTEPSAHPFPQDTAANLLYRLACSAATFSQMRRRDRALLLAWAIACALAPRHYRKNLIEWRFVPTAPPAVVRRLLAIFSSLRPSRLAERA